MPSLAHASRGAVRTSHTGQLCCGVPYRSSSPSPIQLLSLSLTSHASTGIGILARAITRVESAPFPAHLDPARGLLAALLPGEQHWVVDAIFRRYPRDEPNTCQRPSVTSARFLSLTSNVHVSHACT